MNIKTWQPTQFLPLLLVGSMALTRLQHFGSATLLPDASLAVFFLAGLCFNSFLVLGLLIIEAGLIDYIAIAQFGVSDFCISPAYFALLPAYAAVWYGGRYAQHFAGLHFADSIKTFGLAAMAATVSYTLSNGSFYILSGKFGELSWHNYISQFIQYYSQYLSATLIYVFLGLLVIKIRQVIRALQIA